jgi:hypothetical protein
MLQNLGKMWNFTPSLIWENFCLCHRPHYDLPHIKTFLPWMCCKQEIIDDGSPLRFSDTIWIPAGWAMLIQEALRIGANKLRIRLHPVGAVPSRDHTCPIGTLFCSLPVHEHTCLAVVACRDNQPLIVGGNVMMSDWDFDKMARVFWFENSQR